MAKLNQIIAVLSGVKSRTQKTLTEIYHKVQKDTLFQGISRVYQKLNEEDQDDQPPEKKLVQYSVSQALDEAEKAVSELFDTTITQDVANCVAKGDIKIDGQTLVAEVPVTHLLFLEKQLTDLHTFVSKLPTLDPAESWAFDEATNTWKSELSRTNRTKKQMRTHVKYEATKEHPAQTEVYTEDVKVGEWHTTKFSGVMPAKSQKEMLERISALQEAVKFAREEANGIVVTERKSAKVIFDYAFRGKK